MNFRHLLGCDTIGLDGVRYREVSLYFSFCHIMSYLLTRLLMPYPKILERELMETEEMSRLTKGDWPSYS